MRKCKLCQFVTTDLNIIEHIKNNHQEEYNKIIEEFFDNMVKEIVEKVFRSAVF
jgi:hypothetical protein